MRKVRESHVFLCALRSTLPLPDGALQAGLLAGQGALQLTHHGRFLHTPNTARRIIILEGIYTALSATQSAVQLKYTQKLYHET